MGATVSAQIASLEELRDFTEIINLGDLRLQMIQNIKVKNEVVMKIKDADGNLAYENKLKNMRNPKLGAWNQSQHKYSKRSRPTKFNKCRKI